MGSRLHGNDGGRRRTPHGRRQCTHIVIPRDGGRQRARIVISPRRRESTAGGDRDGFPSTRERRWATGTPHGRGRLRWMGSRLHGNDGRAAGMTGTGPAPAPFMPLPLLGYSMGMAGTRENLTDAVESYLSDLRRVRASGGATGERSYYPPLSNLLNAVVLPSAARSGPGSTASASSPSRARAIPTSASTPPGRRSGAGCARGRPRSAA